MNDPMNDSPSAIPPPEPPAAPPVSSGATNEERQRLAREIHDGIAQELVIIGYGIDNAIGRLPEDAQESAEELKELRVEVTRVIDELRLSLFELRSEVDRQGGLTAAVAEYARTVGASGGLRVHLSLDESTARLPAATEAELLRIAQEAVTNARKHAPDAAVTVRLRHLPDGIEVAVRNGPSTRPGPTLPGAGLGLVGLRERIELTGGRLSAGPTTDGGFLLRALVPVEELP